MKKFTRNPWILGIGTTVIGGVLLSLVQDWINEVDWFSTLKSVIKLIANAVIAFLNFELKVWWVLVAIASVIVILIIVIAILDAKPQIIPFLSYTKDSVLGYTWEWDYVKNYDGKYTISNLHPVCSECGMRLKHGGLYGLEMECLRCNTTQKWDDDYINDARMLIEDNIKKNYLQTQ